MILYKIPYPFNFIKSLKDILNVIKINNSEIENLSEQLNFLTI